MTQDLTRLGHVLERLGRPRLLVVGDLMLDHYVFGKVERISPEAPIQILRVEREERKPGGAGSVVAMLRKLEAEVAVVGAVGRDEAGEELCAALERLGADVSGIVRVAGRPTTLKTRFIASVQHVLRVDREVDGPYDAAVDAELRGHVRRLAGAADLISVSDYGKGLLKGGLLPEIVAEKRRSGKEVILDPKTDFPLYRGVTAITPNRGEAERATGIRPREGDPESWRRAGEKLVRDLDLDAAVITLDREGMYFVPGQASGLGLQASGGDVEASADLDAPRREGPGSFPKPEACSLEPAVPRHFPTLARAVYDVTGAGDMVLSMIALCRAAKVPWADALALANAAAGVEVSRVGVAPLSRREVMHGLFEADPGYADKVVTPEVFVAEVLPELRRKRRRIVFTNGCFDVLHVGHVKYFQFARAQGDALVVALNSDRSVREIKGAGRPIMGESDRVHMLAALASIDYVMVFDETTPIRLIEAILPEVLVKAEDYRGKPIVGQAAVEKAGGKLVLAPLVGGVSTSQVLVTIADKVRTADDAEGRAARAAAEHVYAAVEAEARERAAGSGGNATTSDGGG